MTFLTIGQVASRAGVGIDTVRFYEREGLLPKPARTASGYRQFDKAIVVRLQFIQRAKDLGFTLGEIKELLALRVDPGTACDDVKARAETKIADIEEKIRSLQRIKKALVRLTRECCEHDRNSDCPILAALEGTPRRSNTETNK